MNKNVQKYRKPQQYISSEKAYSYWRLPVKLAY